METFEKYNKLTVLKKYRRAGDMRAWVKCECGTEKEVRYYQLKAKKPILSCGCAVGEANSKRNKAGGYSGSNNGRFQHGGKGTRLYNIWKGMRRRCTNPNDLSYKWYGEKGIKVCDEWSNFQAFSDWANANGYQENLSIDRIDSDLNYSPENCRWATDLEQSRNQRNNRYVDWQGVKMTISEASERFGIHSATLISRLNKGWAVSRALLPKTHKTSKSYG